MYYINFTFGYYSKKNVYNILNQNFLLNYFLQTSIELFIVFTAIYYHIF